jgi:hypothetical protein
MFKTPAGLVNLTPQWYIGLCVLMWQNPKGSSAGGSRPTFKSLSPVALISHPKYLIRPHLPALSTAGGYLSSTWAGRTHSNHSIVVDLHWFSKNKALKHPGQQMFCPLHFFFSDTVINSHLEIFHSEDSRGTLKLLGTVMAFSRASAFSGGEVLPGPPYSNRICRRPLGWFPGARKNLLPLLLLPN